MAIALLSLASVAIAEVPADPDGGGAQGGAGSGTHATESIGSGVSVQVSPQTIDNLAIEIEYSKHQQLKSDCETALKQYKLLGDANRELRTSESPDVVLKRLAAPTDTWGKLLSDEERAALATELAELEKAKEPTKGEQTRDLTYKYSAILFEKSTRERDGVPKNAGFKATATKLNGGTCDETCLEAAADLCLYAPPPANLGGGTGVLAGASWQYSVADSLAQTLVQRAETETATWLRDRLVSMICQEEAISNYFQSFCKLTKNQGEEDSTDLGAFSSVLAEALREDIENLPATLSKLATTSTPKEKEEAEALGALVALVLDLKSGQPLLQLLANTGLALDANKSALGVALKKVGAGAELLGDASLAAGPGGRDAAAVARFATERLAEIQSSIGPYCDFIAAAKLAESEEKPQGNNNSGAPQEQKGKDPAKSQETQKPTPGSDRPDSPLCRLRKMGADVTAEKLAPALRAAIQLQGIALGEAKDKTLQYVAAARATVKALGDMVGDKVLAPQIVVALELMEAIASHNYARVALKLVGLFRICGEPAAGDSDTGPTALCLPPKVTRVLNLIADLAQADTPDKIKATLEASIDPVGSWKRKTGGLTLAATGLVGLFGGGEVDIDGPAPGGGAPSFGVNAIVALDLVGPTGKGWTFGGFVSVLDVGQLATAAIRGDKVAGPSDFEVAQILYPGLGLRLGFPNAPFALVGFGGFSPRLRDSTTSDHISVFRGGLALDVDVTLLEIWRK